MNREDILRVAVELGVHVAYSLLLLIGPEFYGDDYYEMKEVLEMCIEEIDND